MTPNEAANLSDSLIRLAKEFKSAAPGDVSVVKRAFREKSKNDLLRTVTYLLEVVGVRDGQYNQILDENKDLKELLKLNNISLEDSENDKKDTTETVTEGTGAAAVVGGIASTET